MVVQVKCMYNYIKNWLISLLLSISKLNISQVWGSFSVFQDGFIQMQPYINFAFVSWKSRPPYFLFPLLPLIKVQIAKPLCSASPRLKIFVSSFAQNPLFMLILSNFQLPMEIFCHHFVGFGTTGDIGEWQGRTWLCFIDYITAYGWQENQFSLKFEFDN